MDYRIVYFGSQTVFLILFLVLCFLRRSGRREQRFDMLDILYLLFVIVSFLDGIWILIDGTPQYRLFNVALQIIYLTAMAFTGYVWFLYTLDLFPAKLNKLKRVRYVLLIPVILEVICILVSVRTGWVFKVDEQSIYSRGPIHIYTVILNYIYMLLGSFVAFRCRNEALLDLDKRRFTVAGLFPLPVLLFSAAQMALPPGLPAMEGGVVIALIMLYGVSQNSMLITDYLTGLPNRFAFEQELMERIHRQKRSRGRLLLLMEGDLDRFKEINDTYGHPVGDKALLLAAEALRRIFYKYGAAVFRTGGDEFMVIYESDEQPDIDSLRKELNEELAKVPSPENFMLSMSLGVAGYEAGMRSHDLIESVDKSLYTAKEKINGNY